MLENDPDLNLTERFADAVRKLKVIQEDPIFPKRTVENVANRLTTLYGSVVLLGMFPIPTTGWSDFMRRRGEESLPMCSRDRLPSWL